MSEAEPSSILEAIQELFKSAHRVSHEVDGARIDGHLQGLVDLANKTPGIGIPVTLSTPAGLICGDLMSRKEYFLEFGALYRRAFEGAFPTQDWSGLTSLYEAKANFANEDDSYAVPPQFVHLRNSSALDASGRRIVSGKGSLWRGTLSSISGFSLGSLSSI